MVENSLRYKNLWRVKLNLNLHQSTSSELNATWKWSEFWVFSGPYFPISKSIFSRNTRKYGPDWIREKTDQTKYEKMRRNSEFGHFSQSDNHWRNRVASKIHSVKVFKVTRGVFRTQSIKHLRQSFLAKIAAIFAKSSILDVRLGSEYTYGYLNPLTTNVPHHIEPVSFFVL